MRAGRRAFVVVLDACGAGALPDAQEYGDAGANTLAHLADAVGGLQLPALQGLGLGSILHLKGVPPAARPALHGRLHALGPGKDSIAGHWELMGVVMPAPMPTFSNGFPPEVVSLVSAAAGRELICNRPYEGTGAIDDFGAEHLRRGALIIYTSEDSVLQIAAHSDVVPDAELQEICLRVRDRLTGQHAVGRVIARPFEGAPECFRRTEGRHDYPVPPPTPSRLEEVQSSGVPVHAVGKAGELFGGRGVNEHHPGATNERALIETTRLLHTLESGLVFTNLVETDQLYGHRHDVQGFHQALQAIDTAVAGWLECLRAGDLLVLSADHGCDPTAAKSDHTREHVPLLAVFEGHTGRRHDGAMADVGASVVHWLLGAASDSIPGRQFIEPGRSGVGAGA